LCKYFKIKLLLYFLFWASICHAQYNLKENNVWAFGIYAGLDFNSGNPVAINSGINDHHFLEGCASVCDSEGNLMFYCSSDTIWNRLGQIMPNGYNLKPYKNLLGHDSFCSGASATQGALIMPVIGNNSQFYVFSLEQSEDILLGDSGCCRLYYCIVDMTLKNGLGDVLSNKKGIKIDSNLSEKMIAIPDNNCGLWLLVHSIKSNQFKAYNLSTSGINLIPTTSNVGPQFSMENYGSGTMKVSNNWNQIIICGGIVITNVGVELLSFDRSTGSLSNTQLLSSSNMIYGACFSPDNSKLYLSEYDGTILSIIQYDLSQSTLSAIQNSKVVIGSSYSGSFSDLKIGNDEKIYFYMNNPDSLDVIDSPNNASIACHYIPKKVPLLPHTMASYGFPNQYVKPTCTLSSHTISKNTTLLVYPNPIENELFIENSSIGTLYSVFDITGRMLIHGQINAAKELINISQLANGTYLLQLIRTDGSREIRKIVKQ